MWWAKTKEGFFFGLGLWFAYGILMLLISVLIWILGHVQGTPQFGNPFQQNQPAEIRR